MKHTIFQETMTGFVVAFSVLFVGFQDQEPLAPDYSADCSTSGCHDEYGKREVIHDPVGSGDCDSCHEEVEGEDHRFQLIAEGAELCAECHDDVTEDLKFVHGPVAAGACTICHDVHASDYPALQPAEGTSLCLECHTDMKERMEGMAFKHDPAVDDCSACHKAHGADNRMNLAMQAPDLCLDCHTEIEDAMDEATVSHEAMTSDRSCAGCHDPHATAVEHILLEEPMELCMSCHEEELVSGDDKISGLGLLLEKHTNHHGPIKDRNCTSCHTGVHGGTKFRLLVEEYPPSFYAPYAEKNYALCFYCHEPDLVKEERTENLTGFRNGDLNLHYLHVNKKDKGRTCRTCHDTHASSNQLHLTQSVPFGKSGWEIPINFKKTDSGGSCLPGCHKKYDYDRTKPVVNIPRQGG